MNDLQFNDQDGFAKPEVTGHRLFQFSVSALLIVLTITSVVLAAYIGIGRAFGMTNVDMLQYGFGRFIFTLPMLVVWAVGLAIAIRRRRSHPGQGTLLVVAFSGLLVTAFVSDVLHMVMIHMISSNQLSATWLFGVVSFAHVLLNTAWWILILLALFSVPRSESRITDG